MAQDIIDATLENEDLQLHRYALGTVVSESVVGFLDRASMMINVVNALNKEDELVVIAHELGHYRLHLDPRHEITNVRPNLGGEPIDMGVGNMEGYSSRERKEVQADIFAGEFLCPADWLAREIMTNGRRPKEIAESLGLPLSLVINQAIRATLLPALQRRENKELPVKHQLNEEQQRAVEWMGGPLLLDAGPGTGKTATLVARVEFLLRGGASPRSILALTFSNRAAEEMRERIAARDPAAGIEMWTGTFHAFGLEVVTKWHDRVERSADVRVLDQAGSLGLLEDNLDILPLRFYQNLYEPAYELVSVLRAISRCKDELITAEMYKEEATKALVAAQSEDEREVAEKALEVAEIYEIYERLLAEGDLVDFGDLVMKPALMLEKHADIRQYFQQMFDHVLVDEFQDVNLASARLLRVLVGVDTDVWVVGDPRQSIYRFRGAEPSNMERFESDFGGKRISLAVNYRSGAPIVRAFQQFAQSMANSPPGSRWASNRGLIGDVRQVTAPTVAAEAATIKRNIEELHDQGVPYRDQVVLARSHLTLERITQGLESLGVPLFYLGDVFEREEIRDLLSLVSIFAEPGGIGLVRIAQLHEYGASKTDALAVIDWAKKAGVSVSDALRHMAEMGGISESGRKGLNLLADHLDGFGPETTAWTLLTTWLFERSSYLRRIIEENSASSRQKLIAIYQLLKVCGEFGDGGYHMPSSFLSKIRRVEALNDERVYRNVASEAEGTDAVRVMTVHGSKGLEFRAVHLPGLATRYMPATRQAIRCPPPPSLGHLAMGPEDHAAEEECLFFVALSRAEDYLLLSRAEKYTTQNSSASKFLSRIGVESSATQMRVQELRTDPELKFEPPAPRHRYQERELTLYSQCPARYRYEVIDNLRGGSDDTPYVRFHRCVYRTIGWLEDRRAEGSAPKQHEALAHLEEQWANRGPTGHGFELYYRAEAERMVKRMVEVIALEQGSYNRDEWDVEVDDGKCVVITPDRVVMSPDGIVHIQRIRTGRRSESEAKRPIYALLQKGALDRYPADCVSIETFYLAIGETVTVKPSNVEKLLDTYRSAIRGIEDGRFSVEPADSRRCPSCQCYFICGI